MPDFRRLILKGAFTEMWAGLAIIGIAAAVCLPSSRSAGFGCLIGGVLGGILLSPIFAKLLFRATEAEAECLRQELEGIQQRHEQVLNGIADAQKTIAKRKADLNEVTEQLQKVTTENRALKMSSIEVRDLSPILKLMLLQWKWKVWEPREIPMGGRLTYRGLRTIDLTANLGVDFDQLRWVETETSINVYGFKKARLFEDIGKREWVYKEVRERNVVFPGVTVYDDHDQLHRYTDLHDTEVQDRVNSSGIGDCESIDNVLKEACRRLIRLAFKTSRKEINFINGDPPPTSVSLADRLGDGCF
jgi:hypothetical protein